MSRSQPYIVQIGNSYYIACDDKAIAVEPSKFSMALVDLISVYYAFNASLPKCFEIFYQFVEVLMFDMHTKLSSKATSLLKDLML